MDHGWQNKTSSAQVSRAMCKFTLFSGKFQGSLPIDTLNYHARGNARLSGRAAAIGIIEIGSGSQLKEKNDTWTRNVGWLPPFESAGYGFWKRRLQIAG